MLQTQVVQPTSNTLANTDIKKPLPGIQAPPTHTDVKHQYPKDEKKKMKQPMRNSLPPQHIKLPSPTSYNYNNRASSPTSTITTTPPLTPQLFHNPSGNRSFSSFSFQSSTVSDPLLDHSHLKPGQNASLLSYNKTIDMYRENARKTNNMDVQCDFAIFLVEAAKRFPDDDEGYIQEAEKLLKQVAVRGHSESQYYLANMYAAGLLNKQSPDFEKAFPLFVQSAKHHHPDAAYRTAKCYEEGLGTRRDKGKAVQFYRKAATLNHPGAMYRLGLAEMKGELSLSRNMRDGHKWLKRSSEAATPQYPHALHELGLLHEKGCEPVIFSDLKYAVSLYHDAAALGYAPSAYRLGQCYEFGKLNVTPDPTLSITYYSIAAEQNHPDACFSLTAWYLVGIPDSLEPSDELAYAWAMRAAEYGLPRAEYAVGYFMEMGIGTDKDEAKAIEYYQKAAQHGEKRALQRLGQHPIVESQQKQKKKLFSDGSSPVPSKRESAAKNRMSFMSVSSRQSSTGSLFQKATSFWRRSSMQK